MLITIQCPNRSKLRAGLWEAEVMLGMEAEVFEGNVFEIAVHDKAKVDHILSKCDGRVIGQAAYKVVKPT